MTSSLIPPSWNASYEQWKQTRLPSLLEKDWKTAFSDYPWISFTDSPFIAFSKPLNLSRIALISSAGVSLTTQPPYDAEDPFGDHSFRIIDAQSPLPSWQVHHGHYDTSSAQIDYNTVFPLDILRQLAHNGNIGSLAKENYTFMGYQPDPRLFYEDSAGKILEGLRAQEVDAVLLIPG
ncbi:glycine/sarcosine/betaine reductase selenoprotein B family protein [Sulfobacillus thermosulfidooxidans]|uniref:glycine/sarcosine/betaine reductase selenoprotein B family protein n=1 Tax=Sulfobacillus thermosulfidooxidans TaxID=28034 RepID=UPI0006B5D698|nr:glycine/sarcosine/betaine reductase selenoprotein B family protein [Sulfobacillus thermosulfidooxidans]